MKILLFGNSGSGKSTYAGWLASVYGLAHLDLDTLVWEPNRIAVARDKELVQSEIDQFRTLHKHWVIEGCYGELIQYLSADCTELVFMNPGMEVCLRHSHLRPWEPHKYVSPDAQQQMLPNLLKWIGDYYLREDSWSYVRHRRIFDEFGGNKREIIDPRQWE